MPGNSTISTSNATTATTIAPTRSEDPLLLYACEEGTGYDCANECVSLEECDSCQCALLDQSPGGPWGDVGDFFLILLPIAVLVFVTVKPNPYPTTVSLPLAAFLMFLVRLMYLGSDPLLTCGAVVLGVHEALTPLSIVAGAMFLFATMEDTNCLPYMMREMKILTGGHPIAEFLLIFAFAYMVEGASGFGTPAALSAPMLVSFGHQKLPSVVTLLLFNTFATVWGAVGTPLWFGFGELNLSEAELLEVSMKSGVALAFGGLILVPFILTILVPFRIVRRSIGFAFLSLLCTIGPSLGLSFVSYEFPALMGGLIGCALNSILIKFKVGLRTITDEDREAILQYREGAVASTKDDVFSQLGSEEKTENNEEAVLSPPVSSTSALSIVTGTKESPTEVTNKEQKDEPGNGEGFETKLEEETGGGATNTSDNDEEVHLSPLCKGSAEQNGMVSLDDDNNDEKYRGDDAIAANTYPEDGLGIDDDVHRGHDHHDDPNLGPRATGTFAYVGQLLLRTFPIWGVVLILILTRVPQIGIKPYLTMQDPAFEIDFQTYGLFRCSVSVVLQLRNILTYPNLDWKYEVFYIPCIIPFFIVSLATYAVYCNECTVGPWKTTKHVCSRLVNPAIALIGALVLVQLMIRIGESSPAYILGVVLAKWLRQGFVVIAPLLGALGSFFSGSTTVSNLTFGPIQEVAAEAIGVSTTSMLALQAVGASAGNGICLNNIIAACTVVGLLVGEGQVLMKTGKYVLANLLIALVVMLAFFIRFK